MKSKLAYDYISGIRKETWTRHTFHPRSKVDLPVNNLYVFFNYYILMARNKPILAMTEWIRTTFMQRFQVKRDGSRSIRC